MRLESIARVIRSKNAGPCLLTFDLMLPDRATFAYVTERAASLRRQVAQRYGRSENEIAVLPFEPALAVKITLPRDVGRCRRSGCLWRPAARAALGYRAMTAIGRLLADFSRRRRPLRSLGASGQLGYGIPTPALEADLRGHPT